MTQLSAALIVASCIKTTQEIVQANALGYNVMERPMYCGYKAEMYSYAYHTRTCKQSLWLLKPKCNARLKKWIKNS